MKTDMTITIPVPDLEKVADTLGLMLPVSRETNLRIYRDQDGYQHWVVDNDSITNEFLSEVYQSVFLTGDICSIRSQLYRHKLKLKAMEGASFLTVASIIKHIQPSAGDMKVLSRLLAWLDGNMR